MNAIVPQEDVLIEEESFEIDVARERPIKSKLIIVGILVVAILVSIFPLASVFSSPETYMGINTTLDEKKNNVMALTASTTAASAAVSLLPGDAGSAIADKLADLSSYCLIILAVIYCEKFLMTTFGFLAFTFLIPIACALFGGALFARNGTRLKENLRKVASKLLAFGVAIMLLVPVSVGISDTIDSSFEASLQQATEATQAATQEIEAEAESEEEEEESGFFEGLVSSVQKGYETLTQGAENALNSLAQQLNTMIDTIAVMIVTSCLIPLIVLAFFLWLIKAITGVDFGSVSTVMKATGKKRRELASALKLQEEE